MDSGGDPGGNETRRVTVVTSGISAILKSHPQVRGQPHALTIGGTAAVSRCALTSAHRHFRTGRRLRRGVPRGDLEPPFKVNDWRKMRMLVETQLDLLPFQHTWNLGR